MGSQRPPGAQPVPLPTPFLEPGSRRQVKTLTMSAGAPPAPCSFSPLDPWGLGADSWVHPLTRSLALSTPLQMPAGWMDFTDPLRP